MIKSVLINGRIWSNASIGDKHFVCHTCTGPLFQSQDCCCPAMNSSSITNSSDFLDYYSMTGKLEYNCSQYEFDKEPPNVTQHFDGTVQKYLIDFRYIITKVINCSVGDRRFRICLWRDGQLRSAHANLPGPNLQQRPKVSVGMATTAQLDQ